MEGWIKLHRSITDNWIWNDKPFTRGQAFVDLLLEVNHTDNKVLINGQLVEVKAGEKITSLHNLAERYGWSTGKVKRFLEMLESDGMVELKTERQYTLVKVRNYAVYQSYDKPKRNANETQTKHARNTDETQTKPNKNDKNVRMKECKNITSEAPAREAIWDYAPDVLMTDEQACKLIEWCSPEELEQYVVNLQEYIENGHTVHNCYETICRWKERDSTTRRSRNASTV